MPELPEVEATRRGLLRAVVGAKVAALEVYDGRLRWTVPRDLPRAVLGRRVEAIDRRGKYLLFRFGADTMIVHLGMTGSLTLHRLAPARRKHDHVDLVLEGGATVRFHDPRRFGAILWHPAGAPAHPLLAGLGPEPFDTAFSADYLYAQLRGRRAAVKTMLMDAGVVVGVGNIYAAEALFRAGIRPATPAGRVSKARVARLVECVREVLAESIARGGTTLRDYVGAGGEVGGFQHETRVYGREGLPCRVCGTTIRGVRLGQRASAYCPNCQKR
jgi:formamidopyrimidine-DNA glycosylase